MQTPFLVYMLACDSCDRSATSGRRAWERSAQDVKDSKRVGGRALACVHPCRWRRCERMLPAREKEREHVMQQLMQSSPPDGRMHVSFFPFTSHLEALEMLIQ